MTDNTPKTRAPLMLLELNEANRELMSSAGATLRLAHLNRILGFHETRTATDDTYDSNRLEPWVQWVSVHTGKPAVVHDIVHLGDVPNLDVPQVWEQLSEHGVSSGVWGVMNGSRRQADNCKFFMADPWTFDSAPYPNSLIPLSGLATYMAKSYLDLSPLKLASHGWDYGFALLRLLSPADLASASRVLLEGLAQFGPTNAVLGAFYEYVSTLCFLRLRRHDKPRFSILFMNLVAHTQHHYWNASKLTPQLAYAFKVIDLAVGRILDSLDSDEVLLVANALSQVNTNSDEPWVLYRQKDPVKFPSAVGVPCKRVEPLMTHDSHLFFDNDAEKKNAMATLSSAQVNGKPLFYVDDDLKNPKKLFYRLEFTDDIQPPVTFELAGKTHDFFTYFERVVVRTGKHCPDGFVLQNQRIMPERIYNHEIYSYICRHFGLPVDSAVETADFAHVNRV